MVASKRRRHESRPQRLRSQNRSAAGLVRNQSQRADPKPLPGHVSEKGRMFDMNTNVIALGVALTLASAVPAGAQTIVDMSLVSCDQFLKSPKPRRDVLSSWVGGYYGAT